MHTITREEYENRIEWGVVLYHANGGNTVAKFNDLNTALLFCRYLNGGTIERWPYELLPEKENDKCIQ